MSSDASASAKPQAAAAVRVDSVSMVFNAGNVNHVDALSEIDMSVAAGEFVSLIGPSGCGKSTLLRLVANLLAPTSGHVVVNGKRIWISNSGLLLELLREMF